MDSTMISTLIGAGIGAVAALLGAFGATFFAQSLSKKQSLEQNYDEKIEELQNLYLEVKTHIEAELREWWIDVEINNSVPTPSNYIYPIDKIIMFVERYEPSLGEDMEQVLEAIQTLRGNDDPDDWIPLQEYYYQYIKGIDFSKTCASLANKFKKINQKYYQKRSSKSLVPFKKTAARSNNQNQIQLPLVLENTGHKTISDDDW